MSHTRTARPQTPASDFKNADAVFRGRVTNIGFRWFSGTVPVTFEVEQSWKGVDTNLVTIYTEPDSGEGFKFKSGETYIVYAYQHNGVLNTDQCWETSTVEDATAQLNDLSSRSLVPISHSVFNGNAKLALITVGIVVLFVGVGYAATRFMQRAA